MFYGKSIAVTTGLLNALEKDEVEAVIGHEIGHIKNRDIEFMMVLAILPAIFYLIGKSAYDALVYSKRRSSSRDDEADLVEAILALIAIVSYLIYYILYFVSLWVSRLREYYADKYASEVIHKGNVKLAKALIKLQNHNATKMRIKEQMKSKINAFRALMITDPLKKTRRTNDIKQAIIYEVTRRISIWERISELFSTHPLTSKRIRKLLIK